MIANHASLQFRITTWPGQPLPIPIVEVCDVTLDGDWLEFEFVNYRAVQPPEELYLRELADLDLSSAQAILRFTASYGRLGSSGWKDLMPGEWARGGTWLAELDRRRDEFYASRGMQDAQALYENDFQSLDEFRVHATMLRDFTRIYANYLGQLSFANLVAAWENVVYRPPRNQNVACLFLIDFLSAGLRPYHARLERIDPGEKRQREPRPANLYQTCCLQLYNHIAESATYAHCANEACGRVFVRQRGRAKYGRYRTTKVDYCSSTCARAQEQRKLRRNQAAAQQLRKQGLPPEDIAATLEATPESVRRWLAAVEKRKRGAKKGSGS
jgi:hypothetical protein